jgi:hypothetical protein
MDTQVTEIFGRNRLVNDLLLSGVEVATPARDRGVDLIAYLDLVEQGGRFSAVPIQIKTATRESFVIDAKYAKFANLIIAFVWGIERPETAVVYALSYEEALEIGRTMGWLATRSWTERGSYSTTAPSQKLRKLLEPFAMVPGTWRKRIEAVPISWTP